MKNALGFSGFVLSLASLTIFIIMAILRLIGVIPRFLNPTFVAVLGVLSVIGFIFCMVQATRSKYPSTMWGLALNAIFLFVVCFYFLRLIIFYI